MTEGSKVYRMRATTIVPASVMGADVDRTVATDEAVDLPEAYGDHLVAEMLAVDAEYGSETPELVAITHTNLHDAVADALMSLSPEVGGDGVPNVSAVRDHVAAAMGITQAEAKDAVTTKLRNAVWAELQE